MAIHAIQRLQMREHHPSLRQADVACELWPATQRKSLGCRSRNDLVSATAATVARSASNYSCAARACRAVGEWATARQPILEQGDEDAGGGASRGRPHSEVKSTASMNLVPRERPSWRVARAAPRGAHQRQLQGDAQIGQRLHGRAM